jgi:hypothetical protein
MPRYFWLSARHSVSKIVKKNWHLVWCYLSLESFDIFFGLNKVGVSDYEDSTWVAVLVRGYVWFTLVLGCQPLGILTKLALTTCTPILISLSSHGCKNLCSGSQILSHTSPEVENVPRRIVPLCTVLNSPKFVFPQILTQWHFTVLFIF